MTQRWRAERPGANEHAPYYASYIAEAPDGDLVDHLERRGRDFAALLRGLPETKGDHRYAPGKWTIKDLVQHLCDAERVFAYRILRFSRNDGTALPGWDENIYAANAAADQRKLGDLADEFEAVRRSTVALLRPLSDDQMARSGMANNNPVTARAIAWIIAGHAVHHESVLRERYL